MEVKGNMKVYFEAVMQEMNNAMNLEGMDEERHNDIGEAILNTAFDRDGARTAETQSNDKLLFISNKIFKPFSEIFTNLESLENIAVYARSFPYKRKGISQADYP